MMRKMKRKRSISKRKGEPRSSPTTTITCSSSSIEEEEEEEEDDENKEKDKSPLRPIFCLKNVVDLKRFDEMEDCYFLEFDPFQSLNLTISFPNDNQSDSDLSLVAEKGQVACRDYPHARYLCLKFPFHTTPHESYCDMCYCYVCDMIAPCHHWTPHCHASHTDPFWKRERRSNKNKNNINSPSPLLL